MGAGTDGYSSGERIVDAGSTTEGYIEVYELEEQFSELYNMDGKVYIEDETELGW